MFNLLFELSVITGVFLFLVCMNILGVIIFLACHYSFSINLSKQHIQIGRILFRTSASLLALLLSFTFASQRVDYYTLKQSLESEASQLVDIHMDLELYGNHPAARIREKIRNYVGVILAEGWKPISENPFQSRTYLHFFEIYRDIHHLEIENDYQQQLKSNLIADIDEISDYMQVRIYKTRPEIPFLLYIALFGFGVVMIFFSVYNPDRVSISFVTLYNSFVGLILYFIILMNNPLIGPIQIQPESFRILQEAIDQE